MQGLQIELLGGLGRHKLHRWPLHCFGYRLRIAEVVLLSLRIGPNVLRRHQPGIVTQCREFATEMMRPDAGLHTDQASRHVGKACFHLATLPLLTQYDRAAFIVAYDVERALANINADYGDRGAGLLGFWDMACSCLLAPLASMNWLAG